MNKILGALLLLLIAAVTTSAQCPGGGNGDYQQNTSGSCAASSTNETSSTVNVKKSESFAGQNPWIDITAPAYGARAIVLASLPATTANCTASSATVTLASASTFQNGDGVVVYGCGATNTLSTPGAPTVTPSQTKGAMNTGELVAGPTGATTRSYKIVARDKNGGLTAPGSAGTTTTGAATLGGVNISITSMTRSGNTVTVTSLAHGMPVGCGVGTCPLVYIHGASDPSFDGFFLSTTVPDSTHYTFTQGMDTIAGATTSATGGTMRIENCDMLTWSAVTGAYQYYIYLNISGTYTLVGASRPGELTFEYYGSTANGGVVLPDFVPTTAAGAASNDYLSSTIVSGGGTTTLTLANNAANTVTGAVLKFDDAPAILAAANAAVATSTAGTLRIPSSPANALFPINSHIVLPTGMGALNIQQAGQLYLNETIEVNTGTEWFGDLGGSGNGAVQFSWVYGRPITINSAFPGLDVSQGGSNFRFLAFGAPAQGLIMTLKDVGAGFNDHFAFDNFALQSGVTDYVGQAIVAYATSNNSYDHVTFSVGDSSNFGDSSTPLLLYRNDIGNTAPSGNIFCHLCYFRGRGFVLDSSTPLASGIRVHWDDTYAQDLHSPLMAFTTSNEGIEVTIDGFTNDTSTTAAVANWGSVLAVHISNMVDNSQDTGGSPGIVTGNMISGLSVSNYGTGPVHIGQNRNLFITLPFQMMSIAAYDNFFPLTDAVPTYDYRVMGPLHSPAHYPIYTDLPIPTNVAASVTSGGAVPNGTWTYLVTAIGIDGNETTYGAVSNNCTTTTGNNSCIVTWNTVDGAIAYNCYRSNGGGYDRVHTCSNLTTNTFTDTASFSDGVPIPSSTSTGYAELADDKLIGQQLLLGVGCASAASPAVCGGASSGFVTVAAGATSEVVDSTRVTAKSQIQLTFDSSVGSALSVTCNTTPVQATVSARSAGASFTIAVASAPSTNPACFSYTIIN